MRFGTCASSVPQEVADELNDRMLDAPYWLADETGFELRYADTSPGDVNMWTTTSGGHDIWLTAYGALKDNPNLTLHFEAEATELVRDANGRVRGVVATIDGDSRRLVASVGAATFQDTSRAFEWFAWAMAKPNKELGEGMILNDSTSGGAPEMNTRMFVDGSGKRFMDESAGFLYDHASRLIAGMVVQTRPFGSEAAFIMGFFAVVAAALAVSSAGWAAGQKLDWTPDVPCATCHEVEQ